MDNKRGWTIAIQTTDGKPARKITKILSLNGKGFSVLAPYHQAKSGFLWKMPLPMEVDEPGRHKISQKAGMAFTAEDRIKLSYHADGFAQFSSERVGRIISGIDADSGEPKGLGLFARPLSSPVSSGPSVGVTVWGIEDFEEIKKNEPAVIFQPGDFYYRNCAPAETNGWILSFYVFPTNVVPPVRFVGGQAVLNIAADQCYGAWFNVLQLKLLHLKKERLYLGAYVNAVRGEFRAKSGWALQGPGTPRSPGMRGHQLFGLYPREADMGTGRASLDRNQVE